MAGILKPKFYRRLEVISPRGRELVYYGKTILEEQDGGMTLKIFIDDREEIRRLK